MAYCTQHKLAFILWFPVSSGKLAQPGGKLDELANKHNTTTSQLSLAWLLHHSAVIVPILGTTSIDVIASTGSPLARRVTEFENELRETHPSLLSNVRVRTIYESQISTISDDEFRDLVLGDMN